MPTTNLDAISRTPQRSSVIGPAGQHRRATGRRGSLPMPSRATIARILTRRGQVRPQPHKRPREFVSPFPGWPAK